MPTTMASANNHLARPCGRAAAAGNVKGLARVLSRVPVPVLGRMLRSSSVAGKRPPGGALGDLSQQLDQGLNFSIINSLRTGNMLVDMLVCMLVPMIIRTLLLGDYSSWFERIFAPFQGVFWRKAYIRTIEYVEGGNLRGRFNFMENSQAQMENTDRNNLLHKAIRLYIAEKYGPTGYEMEANLVPTRKVKVETTRDIYGERNVFSGSYQQLLSFAVQMLPRKGNWILVDKERSVYFMQTLNEQNIGAEANAQIQTRTTFSIKCNGPDAGKVVSDWINEAFEWYKDIQKNQQDFSRFFYVAVTGGGDSKDKGQPKALFKQYLLSDTKTFKSLFFPEKENLIRLVDQFQKKLGKFAIEGFPDKLGLLLDGPPGTGKTSLIKALAHHLNRHVVSVNLAKIKTNQELMDLLFDLVFPVQGGDFPVKLKFEDIVFVMEDVDAASKVVYARSGTKKALKKSKKKQKTVVVKGAEASPAIENSAIDAAAEKVPKEPGSADASVETSTTEATETKPEAKDSNAATAGSTTANSNSVERAGSSSSVATPKQAPPKMPKLLRMISGSSAKAAEEEDEEKAGEGKEAEVQKEDDEEEEEEESEDDRKAEADDRTPGASKKAETMVGELICKMMGSGDRSGSDSETGKRAKSFIGPFSKSAYEGDDDLNLAGLLNVLDGVVDSPGRVVVMTTNHPDKLDPALIRPGRINKRIHLGYVEGDTVCKMAEHYMQVKLTSDERKRLHTMIEQRSVTPAQVEQCCAESMDIEELITYIQDLR